MPNLNRLLASNLLALGLCGPAWAQGTAVVDATKPINTLTQLSIGVDPQIADAELFTPKDLATLRSAGISSLSFPSGWGSASQVYHWSTNTTTRNPGAAPENQTVYAIPGNNMGALAGAIRSGITPVMVVDYGSNPKGNGPGEPREAAAWVAYSNGAPGDTRPIGTDSTGTDWKTVGYWASLRAAAPLATDDGLNFLRVSQAQPLAIQLWTIGEDEPSNGFYGGDHKGTADLHAAYPASSKDSDHRAKDPHLSPAFYAERVKEFAAAMKAVDPKVWVGASLATPGVDTWAAGWNETVLKEACASIEFVSFPWHPGTLLPPNYKLMDESNLLNAPQHDLPGILKEALYEDKGGCPAGKVPHIVLSSVGPPFWLKPEHPAVMALFAADAFASTTEAGLAADWVQLRPQGLMTTAYDAQPAFFGLQMLHIVAYRPGDVFLATTGGTGNVAVYATRRQDGLLGVMLVNKDPAAAQKVVLELKGAKLADKGIRFDYGAAQVKSNAGPVKSDLGGVAEKMTVEVPAYSIVDLLMPMVK